MIDAKTRKAWRAKALRAAINIDATRGSAFACCQLGDPDADVRAIFSDALRPSFSERREYGQDDYAWLGRVNALSSDPKDREVRVLALLFFREMLGTPGALSGPDFHLQA